MFLRNLKVADFELEDGHEDYKSTLSYFNRTNIMPYKEYIMVDADALRLYGLDEMIEDDKRKFIMMYPEYFWYNEDEFPDIRFFEKCFMFLREEIESKGLLDVLTEADKLFEVIVFRGQDSAGFLDYQTKPTVDLSRITDRNVFTVLGYVVEALEKDNKRDVADELTGEIMNGSKSYNEAINKMKKYVNFKGL